MSRSRILRHQRHRNDSKHPFWLCSSKGISFMLFCNLCLRPLLPQPHFAWLSQPTYFIQKQYFHRNEPTVLFYVVLQFGWLLSLSRVVTNVAHLLAFTVWQQIFSWRQQWKFQFLFYKYKLFILLSHNQPATNSQVIIEQSSSRMNWTVLTMIKFGFVEIVYVASFDLKFR